MNETETPYAAANVPFSVGAWRADPAACRLERNGETVSLEPKVMDLLALLASAPGRVFSRKEIEAVLWADVTVGEDTLPRAVSRLRRALGDSAQSPTYVETIPKRGYRLLSAAAVAAMKGETQSTPPRRHFSWRVAATASLVLTVAASAIVFQAAEKPEVQPSQSQNDTLTSRADDLYMRFTRADNEAAIALYERVLAADRNHAGAQAGLANALVQRVIRWPNRPGEANASASTLTDALERGLTRTEDAQEALGRAAAMAERAVRLAPDNADALKALGFVYTAQGDLARAEEIYSRAIALDENAWAPLINLGEIHEMRNDKPGAAEKYEQAFAAMERSYEMEPQRVGLWQAALGVLIGKTHEELGAPEEAELWYRRVLHLAPLEPEATTRLAALLRRSGDADEAERLCASLRDKIGVFKGCATGVKN